MGREMEARRRLSPTVTTPTTERLFEAARGAGALGAKVCGAGGGGCSVYWARAGRRERLRRALAAAGGRILPFRVEERGLLATSAPAKS
jgi:D-glycero-alpha-D-manno-heptose-7-phosphate kinase